MDRDDSTRESSKKKQKSDLQNSKKTSLAVVQRPLLGALNYDPPTPPPPLPYPVFEDTCASKRTFPIVYAPAFREPNGFDDDLDVPEFGDIDDALPELMDDIGTTPLYLVRFDAPRLRYLVFCECSRKRLIGKYLEYLLSDSTTAEYTSIRSLSTKMPRECIKQEGLLYTLSCNVPYCSHRESQLSVEELTVRMIVHHLIEHQNKATWRQKIDRRIKQSFEEALAALKDVSE